MAMIVAATLWLQQAELGQERAMVTARFRDVGNMSIGNQVVIRGVQAGRIEAITLVDSGWVTARLSLDPGIKLPPDPVVLIQAATLFGEWQAVVTRREAAPQIREVYSQLDDTVNAPKGALPGAVLPDIAQLTSVAGGIAGNVASVSERVRTAFNDSAARELRLTIRNFSTMSTELTRTVRTQSQNLDVLAAGVREGVGDLSAGAAALQRSLGRLDSATSQGEISEILQETQRAAVSLRETAERINAISRSLAGSEGNLNSILVRTDSIMRRVERGEGSLGLLFRDPSLYRNSDSLILDMRSLIADLQKNPKRYINLSIF
jgi:phospholipid/cholesterol/gamma-HCH transport system substrate-binding protein